jgi:aryl carrier-like protein
VVAGDEDPDARRLVAYIVPRTNTHPSGLELRRFLRAKLPEYMVPSAIGVMTSLPLTPHGKTDVAALPPPDVVRAHEDTECTPPGTDTQRTLAEIWSRVLGITPVGIHDNLFELGGDSIRSLQIVALAKERGLPISVAQIFRHQTIANLSEHLGIDVVPEPREPRVEPFALLSWSDRQHVPDDCSDAYPLAMLQAGLVYHSERSANYQVYVSSFHLRLHLDTRHLRDALQRLAVRHAFLRTSFDLTTFSEPMQLVLVGDVGEPLRRESRAHA